MPQVKIRAKTGKGKTSSVINLITGNEIARDASNGQFFVVKAANIERVNVKDALDKSTLSNSSRSRNGSFTINKRKAEKAEQVVLSYLNKSEK